jgi:hypothetical protein
LRYLSQNRQVKSSVKNLARYMDKGGKIGVVVIINAFYGTDIQSSQYRSVIHTHGARSQHRDGQAVRREG